MTYAGATQDVDGVTRATIGSGQVTVGGDTTPDLAGLNRDVSKAQEIFKAESSKGEITVKIPSDLAQKLKDSFGAQAEIREANTDIIEAVKKERGLAADEKVFVVEGSNGTAQILIAKHNAGANGLDGLPSYEVASVGTLVYSGAGLGLLAYGEATGDFEPLGKYARFQEIQYEVSFCAIYYIYIIPMVEFASGFTV